jgi:hypothetical protein
MHPFYSETIVRTRERELARAVRDIHRRQETTAVRQPIKESVLLRLTTIGDADAIERLAALDSAPAPDSRCVVAEIDGTLVAALPLRGGNVIADPFKPTAHLVPLLELRAKQLAGSRHQQRPTGLRRLVRAFDRA